MLDSCRCGREVQISSHTLHILCPYSAEGDMCSAVEACKNCREGVAVAGKRVLRVTRTNGSPGCDFDASLRDEFH